MPRKMTKLSALTVALIFIAGCSNSSEIGSANTAEPPTTSSEMPKSEASSQEDTLASLKIDIPSTAGDGSLSTYSEDYQGITYKDETKQLSIILEHHAKGSTTAENETNTELDAFKEDNVDVRVTDVEIKGGHDARMLEWTQESPAPWARDASSAEMLTLSAKAVIFEGDNGNVYGVFVASNSDDPDSTEAMDKVLKSIEASQ